MARIPRGRQVALRIRGPDDLLDDPVLGRVLADGEEHLLVHRDVDGVAAEERGQVRVRLARQYAGVDLGGSGVLSESTRLAG
jgi:hypothetical protein